MTHDELRLEYGAYALGIAEDPERSEISEHLANDCAECMAGVRSASATVAVMASAVKPVDPPARLRAKVIAMVTPEPVAEKQRGLFFWMPWAFSGALAAALIAVLLTGLPQKPSGTPASPAGVDVARFNEVLGILNDPVTKDVAFGDPAARGRFFVSPTRGVVFIAAHLPKLDAGRTFEMWVIPAGGKPVPAGTFLALADSTALHIRPGPVDNVAAMAISVEPLGGSPQPTTTPIIVSKL